MVYEIIPTYLGGISSPAVFFFERLAIPDPQERYGISIYLHSGFSTFAHAKSISKDQTNLPISNPQDASEGCPAK